jgi:hypothetical protein
MGMEVSPRRLTLNVVGTWDETVILKSANTTSGSALSGAVALTTKVPGVFPESRKS